MKITGRTEGADKLLRKLRTMGQIPPVIESRVETSATKTRTAGHNVIIVRTQAKQGRRFARLFKHERKVGLRYWRLAMRAAARTPRAAEPILKAAAQKLAVYMVDTYRRHVEQQIGVKDVLPSTQKRKDRQYGPGRQPLVATGQLMRSLKATSTVVR